MLILICGQPQKYMEKGYLQLNLKDLGSAGINAVIAAIFIGLAGIVTTQGFDVFHADWVVIGHSVVNWAFAAFFGSVGKDLLSNKQGKVLGYFSK